MEQKIFSPGNFIEELVFDIKPELIERYIELEYKVMASELCQLPGFVGWDIWVSETNIGEVTSIYYWDSYESYKNINREWLFGKKDELTKLFGKDNLKFIAARHEENRRFRVRSI